ncbi:carbamoyltransferase family protein [Halohasta litorea]|uniref:Carbamoyltransferase n=1 Tax=Halohasta litorea TaxID=869891 RepID=A0ABD6D974_9EURY|nr:carbamoyltransferase C-terminal domain-containing protein [Halohasta litorea]
MTVSYILTFRPSGIDLYHNHDPSAAIFRDGELVFAAEEERYTRQKHGENQFPDNAIQACLDFCGIELHEVDKIIIPDDLRLRRHFLPHRLKSSVFNSESSLQTLYWLNSLLVNHTRSHFTPVEPVRRHLSNTNQQVPPIEAKSHHACHAASAFHPSEFDRALVVTIDGVGEYDSTVVWRGDESGIERLRTYNYPNSLGSFFGTVTEFLGYRKNNGEGKVMGLAPYGNPNTDIAATLRSAVDTGVEYDVTEIVDPKPGQTIDVANLERLFGRQRKETPTEFTQWEKDLAYEAQKLLEEIVTGIVTYYVNKTGINNVALAGGVALNCKLNKAVMDLDEVDNVFIQPVAADNGLALGAGYLEQNPTDVEPMTDVYYGDEFETAEIRNLLETNKIDYYEPDDLEQTVAERLADGELVGWFQGRMELGPRALGNRSILADPRTESSRDRVNEFVKHREGWRPFAPSLRYEDADEYLEDAVESPFMIKTFDIPEHKCDEIAAVIHPNDATTRPQTVRSNQNPRYHALLSAFADITDVPVLLNTSFNDHGEPIIRTPKEAIKAFYAMGLDILVLNDLIIEK